MSLSSLLESKRKELRHRSTILTNMLGEKYEIIDDEMRLIDKGLPFVVDTKPDLQVAFIEPGLYLGSQDPVASVDILRENGIKHVISVGIKLEVRFDGISYYFIDLLDLPESDITESLKTCFSIIRDNRSENIFVHCNAGVSRSSSVVIAYLMMKRKLSYDEAYLRVKVARECIKPNEGFVKQLKALRVDDFSAFLEGF